MKVLNIDALVSPKRSLKFEGKSYVIKEMDVQQFIDSLDSAQKLEAESVPDAGSPEALKKATEGAVKAIVEACVGIDEAKVRKWPLDTMTAVLQFIRGDFDDNENVSDEGAAAEKKPT
jgi:hypothetical protein